MEIFILPPRRDSGESRYIILCSTRLCEGIVRWKSRERGIISMHVYFLTFRQRVNMYLHSTTRLWRVALHYNQLPEKQTPLGVEYFTSKPVIIQTNLKRIFSSYEAITFWRCTRFSTNFNFSCTVRFSISFSIFSNVISLDKWKIS